MKDDRPICVLTGYRDTTISFVNTNPLVVEYTFRPIGRVRIARPTYEQLVNNNQVKYPILAAICRNAFENDEEPPLITAEFISNGIKSLSIPKSFKDKAYHLLRFLYFHGGRDYKAFDLYPYIDYPLSYCEGEAEFA